MTDPLDDLEDDIDARMLVIEETTEGLDVDDPSGKLTADERLAFLLRALILELRDDIIETLASAEGDDDV